MVTTDLRFHFFQIFLSLASAASFSCFFLASRHWGAMNKAPRSTTIAAMALPRMYREDIKAKFRRYSFLLLGSIFFESSADFVFLESIFFENSVFFDYLMSNCFGDSVWFLKLKILSKREDSWSSSFTKSFQCDQIFVKNLWPKKLHLSTFKSIKWVFKLLFRNVDHKFYIILVIFL